MRFYKYIITIILTIITFFIYQRVMHKKGEKYMTFLPIDSSVIHNYIDIDSLTLEYKSCICYRKYLSNIYSVGPSDFVIYCLMELNNKNLIDSLKESSEIYSEGKMKSNIPIQDWFPLSVRDRLLGYSYEIDYDIDNILKHNNSYGGYFFYTEDNYLFIYIYTK
jgi:hypothetical protein